MVKEAIEIEKIAWIIGSAEYDQLRKMKGCDRLNDLPAIYKDLEVISRLVDCMMVTNDAEHRILCLNPTFKEMQ